MSEDIFSEETKRLRDEFAMAALQGILAGPSARDGVPVKEWLESPRICYEIADAMLEARKK